MEYTIEKALDVLGNVYFPEEVWLIDMGLFETAEIKFKFRYWEDHYIEEHLWTYPRGKVL